MRKVCFSAATSLDGFIAGPNGEHDWIPMDPDIDFRSLFGRFDTILMGRKTYEAAKAMGDGGMPGMSAYVFSRTLRQENVQNATVSSDPEETVAELRGKSGKDLWLFGGGGLLSTFLDLGLVDEIQLAVTPVLLGGGTPLLPSGTMRELRLTAHRIYEKTGTAMLEFAPRRT